MVLPDKKDNLEVKRQVVELFKLRKQFNEMEKAYQDKKEKLTVAIKNYMYGMIFSFGSNQNKAVIK